MQQVNGTSVKLQWNKVQGTLGYVIRYKVVGTSNWKLEGSKDTSKRLSDLTSGKSYTWQVRSVCDTITRSLSDWSSNNIFKIDQQNINDLISFGPNPLHDALYIHIKDLSVSQIIITDLTGRPFTKINSVKPDENISFSKLTSGTYTLQLLDKNNNILATTSVFKQ